MELEDDMDLAVYTFIILHELGHCVSYAYFFKRLTNNNFSKYNAMRDIFSGTIYNSLIAKNKNDRIFNYDYDPEEQIATAFAYKNFYYTWSMLIEKGLIN